MRLWRACRREIENLLKILAPPEGVAKRTIEKVTGELVRLRPALQSGSVNRTNTNAVERVQDGVEPFGKTVRADSKITKIRPGQRGDLSDMTAAKRLRIFLEDPSQPRQTNRILIACQLIVIE